MQSLSPVLWHLIQHNLVLLLELDRWLHLKRKRLAGLGDQRRAAAWLFDKLPEFRTLVYYRLAAQPELPPGAGLVCRLVRRLLPPRPNLYLNCQSIGPGLYIHHGDCSHVNGMLIGRNLWFSQQVTIGKSKGGFPTIGDDVRVSAGAKIFGANAVVNKDVPSDCTVVGFPAHLAPLRPTRGRTARPVEGQ